MSFSLVSDIVDRKNKAYAIKYKSRLNEKEADLKQTESVSAAMRNMSDTQQLFGIRNISDTQTLHGTVDDGVSIA